MERAEPQHEYDRGQERATEIASVPVHLAARVASTRSSILITGETGVGKGYLANWLHDHSPEHRGPFVPVNCGAIPDGIIDSHLFGHARGSFSDAHQDHLGLVRAAEGGTLFLDEVGELPAKVQIRLLRLLEEREVQPVGTNRPLSVNVRIIAASGCDLEGLVRRGLMRPDLFYRLNVIHLKVRPLRARVHEIPALVDAFNREFADRGGRAPMAFTGEALEGLARHRWPGNVRQLRTVIERLHVLCPASRVGRGELQRCGQLPVPAPAAPPAEASRRLGMPRLHEARLETVRRTMAVYGGNISRTATALGVHRSTIHRWLALDRRLTA